jgi:hypothetical protein
MVDDYKCIRQNACTLALPPRNRTTALQPNLPASVRIGGRIVSDYASAAMEEGLLVPGDGANGLTHINGPEVAARFEN